LVPKTTTGSPPKLAVDGSHAFFLEFDATVAHARFGEQGGETPTGSLAQRANDNYNGKLGQVGSVRESMPSRR
jgi:hypothetical protein